jgi:hypothetical protein
MSFYTAGREQVVWEEMPQVPAVGDTLHYSLTDNDDDSRAWKVIHVSWVRENGLWHAEIGLS